MLQRLFENVFRNGTPLRPAENGPVALVLSLPGFLRDPVEERLPGVLSTSDVFRRLFGQARRSIKVFSPYVDPTFTGLAQEAQAPIQVVTTLREARQRSNPVLERFAATRPLAVRYLHEKRARAQMFQLHAKMVLADSSMAYLGSANLTDTSLHYNFELGIYLEDRNFIARLSALFDYVFDFAAKPAEAL